MRKARYRIDQVSIEGFRGFTKPQTIAFHGKNLFVFGPNGRGKSSVIEAIRWCLFGGKEIEVRNTFYDEGDCVVTLSLMGDGGPLQLKREMRSIGDRSRLTIRNAANQEVPLNVALPELARIGHEQGTQVIFAAQHATGRQATVDLSDFTQVLCLYLHLEDAPELVQGLGRKYDERSAQSERMAAELASAEQAYRNQITQIQTSLKFILENPPWGEGESPTGEESLRRIATALEEQAHIHDIACPELSGRTALTEMKKWIETTDEKSKSTREARLTELNSKLQQLRIQYNGLKSAAAHSSVRRTDLDSVQTRLSTLLSGSTLEDLSSEVHRIERDMSARDIRAEIARKAESLTAISDIDQCPLCDKRIKVDVLKKMIAGRLGTADAESDDENRLSELQTRIAEIERTKKSLDSLAKSSANADDVEIEAKKNCYGILGFDLSTDVQLVQDTIDKMTVEVESVQREVTQFSNERKRRLRMVKDLETELNYHDYRDQLARAQTSLSKGMDPTRIALAAYRDLLNSVSSIADLVDTAFNNALDRISPDLNNLLTEVYSRLTRQLSYDQVCISRTLDPPIRRELKVASSRLAGQTFAPNVLNGQAAKALQLVPYFVFSRFQSEIMELDLLLIDDPSESFDTSHVESLVVELAAAAEHAQIIVATHEKEKFEVHLKSKFRKKAYQILNVETFDPIKGPQID